MHSTLYHVTRLTPDMDFHWLRHVGIFLSFLYTVVGLAGHHNAVTGINQATKCSYSLADACMRTTSLHAAWQMVLYVGTLENICYRAFDWN